MVGLWQPTTEDDSQKLKQFFLINPMLFLQKFINIKNMCLNNCNILNRLFYKVKIYNTSVKNHYINLIKYHKSRHYGIQQNWSVLLRIGLQKFCKTIFDNIYFKYLYFLNNFLKLFISIIILLILIVSIITFKFKLSLNNSIK